jgi:ferrochelatase
VKTALFIINFGGPQHAGEVESFLYELFRDHDVIPLPGGSWVQEFFATRVSRRRAPKTIAQYELIGGGSPLVPMTYRQAEAVHAAVTAAGHDVSLHVGMRYTAPTIETALEEIRDSGAERIVCLALYPHFSFATTGSSYNEVARALKKLQMDRLPVSFIPAWHDDPAYLEAMADLVKGALARVPEGLEPHLLFTAHGLPVSFIKRGDPYQAQVQQTVRDVVKALGYTGSHSLAYQSRVGPERWLSPSTDSELERLAEAGHQAVVVVPVSFVGDHIETLFELDIEYREVAEHAGIEHYVRAPALDVHPRFIDCLAGQVTKALGEARPRACVRCLLPKDDAYHALRSCPDCRFKKPDYLGVQAQCPSADPTPPQPAPDPAERVTGEA